MRKAVDKTLKEYSAEVQNDFFGELEPVHYRALTLVVAGRSVKEISDELGVCERVIYRWKLRKDFKELQHQGCARAYEAAIAELVLESSYAARELIKIVRNEKTPTKTRLKAIELCLKYASEAREFFLGGKLEKIEKMLSGGSVGIPESIKNLFDKPEEDIADE